MRHEWRVVVKMRIYRSSRLFLCSLLLFRFSGSTSSISSSSSLLSSFFVWHEVLLRSANVLPSDNDDFNNDEWYVDGPGTIFAPSGRLIGIEQALPRVYQPEDDLTNALVVAIQTRHGTAAVASIPYSPYLPVFIQHPNPSNSHQETILESRRNVSSTNHDTIVTNHTTKQPPPPHPPHPLNYNRRLDDSERVIIPPFAILSPRLFAIVAGNAVEGQIVQDQLQSVVHTLLRERGDSGGGGGVGGDSDNDQKKKKSSRPSCSSSSSLSSLGFTLARRVAHQHAMNVHAVQLDPSTTSAPVVCANCAVLIDPSELWRVDIVTGQLYRCRAVVAGRASARAEHQLIENVLEKQLHHHQQQQTFERTTTTHSTPTTTKMTGRIIRQALWDLSLQEALALARSTVLDTLRAVEGKSDRTTRRETSSNSPITSVHPHQQEGESSTSLTQHTSHHRWRGMTLSPEGLVQWYGDCFEANASSDGV